jgi:uncharacterized protein
VVSALSAALTALPVGVAFGVVLERAGLGDSRVIAAQFTGRNFAVVRVMFGAIVTAMLGILWLDVAGLLDVRAIAIPPTDLAGQTVGAVIFGGGFAIAALCPGTACVAAASGRREGVAAVGGLIIGTALTALLWPVFDGTLAPSAREGAQLPDDLGIPIGVVVVGITSLAIAAFSVSRRFDEASERRITWWKLTAPEWVALTLACAFALTSVRTTASIPGLSAIAGEISREADHVDALALAEWIKDGKEGLRIVDVREGLDSSTYVIPGAAQISLDSIVSIVVAPSQHLVLYSDGGAHAAQAWALLRARGLRNVHVLKDGMAAWEDEVMRPAPPSPLNGIIADTAALRFTRARALSLWFGGQPRLQASPSGAGEPARITPTRARRRNTC